MRVAIYVRVSTEEQAKYGFSIQAQKESLLKYAKEHKYEVIDVYSDEGVSGGKLDRPELNRLLEDVKNDKIDMILFIKLDRWFRSVAHYYKIQEILEQHNVVWRTTEEEYETETSSGKFKVNIMLSVSQQMKDATSERIKFVFDNKVKHGGALNGNQPLGYKVATIDNKKIVVKDEIEAPIIMDLIEYFELHQNIRQTTLYMNKKYNMIKTPSLIKDILTNTMYYGSKRNVDTYCEPYISKERWENIQSIIKNKNIKCNSKFDYIFSGILICSECGRKLSGKYCKRPYGQTFYYRCGWYHNNGTCSQSHIIQESILEKDIISYIDKYLANKSINADEVLETSETNQDKIDSLMLEKEKITKAFIKGWITEAEADKQHEAVNKEIENLKNKKSAIKKVATLSNNWLEVYNSLSRKGKQMWLRSIIKNIVVDSNKYIRKEPNYFTINFL